MGKDTLNYAIEKLQNIKDVHHKGGSFISILPNGRPKVWQNFRSVLKNQYNNEFGTVLIDKNSFSYLEEISNNPDTYGMSYEEVINEITKLTNDITKDSVNPIIKQLATNEILNIEIAKAFGKAVNAQGQVILQSVDKFGNILLDENGDPLMTQWWENFKNSNSNEWEDESPNEWYFLNTKILESNIILIKRYYGQISPGYVQDWVKNSFVDLKSLWDSI